MAAIDPLYSVNCGTCGRAYLTRLEELVRADGGCVVCGRGDTATARVPDAEDDAGAPRDALTADLVEWSARLRRESAYLCRQSDRLRADFVAAGAKAERAFGDA